MTKSLLGMLGIIAVSLAAMYFWIGVPAIERPTMPSPQTPHVYEHPDRPIETIEISAFYFVPNDKQDGIGNGWHGRLESTLSALRRFHELQLKSRSHISFTIFPEPVIGEHETLFYDTESTQHGNPHALIAAAEELNRRFLPKTKNPDSATRRVLFILYEGVGAAGGIIHESGRETAADIAAELGLPESVIYVVNIASADGFFILNREYLADAYDPAGASLLAHEFYHTLGIPDAYDESDETPRSDDIMGAGRWQPLEKTYLERNTVQQLGIQ